MACVYAFKKLEPDLGKRLGRFYTMIMAYNFRIFLCKSERNVSDALSRLPSVVNPETGELEYVEEDLVYVREAQEELDASSELDNADDTVVAAVTRFQRQIEGYEDIIDEQSSDPALNAILDKLATAKSVNEGRMTYFKRNNALFVKDRKGFG